MSCLQVVFVLALFLSPFFGGYAAYFMGFDAYGIAIGAVIGVVLVAGLEAGFLMLGWVIVTHNPQQEGMNAGNGKSESNKLANPHERSD
ncbi:MAG: hypothetical protein R3E01_06030 [Pirellulaceae bacterium]